MGRWPSLLEEYAAACILKPCLALPFRCAAIFLHLQATQTSPAAYKPVHAYAGGHGGMHAAQGGVYALELSSEGHCCVMQRKQRAVGPCLGSDLIGQHRVVVLPEQQLLVDSLLKRQPIQRPCKSQEWDLASRTSAGLGQRSGFGSLQRAMYGNFSVNAGLGTFQVLGSDLACR